MKALALRRFDGAAWSRAQRGEFLLAVLPVIVVAMAGISIMIGPAALSPGAAFAVLVDAVGIPAPWEFEAREQAIMTAIRLPRTLLGLLAGGALGLAGAAMQGLFRNPLADPGIAGVSGGAALAAAGTIVVGDWAFPSVMRAFGPYALPAAAFAGGLVATAVVYRIARLGDHTSVATMLLAGIAINALTLAGIGALIYVSSDQQLRDLSFWMIGSLGGASWRTMGPAIPLILAALFLLPRLSAGLNALLLGEREAFHLGFNVEHLKRSVIFAVALGVGATVALTGMIGFFALVVPHVVRLMIGPDHRFLVPASIMLGSASMLGADLIARTVVAPAELPIGIVTSFVGAPFFLWLLIRGRDQVGI